MNELDELKALAGLTKSHDNLSTPNGGMTNQQKSEYMRQHKIRPGDQAWFKLWFAKPHITGEQPI